MVDDKRGWVCPCDQCGEWIKRDEDLVKDGVLD
jgi:hypothetical protein